VTQPNHRSAYWDTALGGTNVESVQFATYEDVTHQQLGLTVYDVQHGSQNYICHYVSSKVTTLIHDHKVIQALLDPSQLPSSMTSANNSPAGHTGGVPAGGGHMVKHDCIKTTPNDCLKSAGLQTILEARLIFVRHPHP
jgi:hypothetical protein